MSNNASFEARLAALEREMIEIKKRLKIDSSENWVDEISGSMEKFPEFDEVVQYGREWREAQTDPY